jgi:hypothetical protein
VAQGGDITNKDGTGGESIYGPKFADENFRHTHCEVGTLSMASAKPNSNSSQFFVSFAEQPHLDRKHVVFGKMVRGEEVLEMMAVRAPSFFFRFLLFCFVVGMLRGSHAVGISAPLPPQPHRRLLSGAHVQVVVFWRPQLTSPSCLVAWKHTGTHACSDVCDSLPRTPTPGGWDERRHPQAESSR